MGDTQDLYTGCPVQHARQFISGKWQMGILWNLKEAPLSFGALKNKLPGLSDKILMQELDFFTEKNIIHRNSDEFSPAKAEYALTSVGLSLIKVIDAIVEWGYAHLQDEQVNAQMSLTPLPAIKAIEKNIIPSA